MPIKPRPSKSGAAGVPGARLGGALGLACALAIGPALAASKVAEKPPTKRSAAATSAKKATPRKPAKAAPSSARTRKAVAAAGSAGSAAVAAPEIAEKRADLTELRGRIETLQKELSASETHRADAADRLRESERKISTQQRELLRLTQQQASLQNALQELAKQSQELAGTLSQQQIRLEQLVYHQYLQGHPGSLQLLLNGNDPNQVARDLHYLSTIAHARADLLTEVQSTLKKKQALAEKTRERAQELADVEAEQRERHEDLIKQREERKVLLAEIAGRIANQRKEIGALQQDEKRLSQLIDRLSKIIASQAGKPKPRPAPGSDEPARPGRVEAENTYHPEPTRGNFAQLKGSLRLPVRGSVIGRFGAPREGGVWKGIFIRAASGSEVRAIANGRVVFADWMRGFGNLLILDHGDGYLSIYGNNDSLLKQVGDSVRGGETVASVGNSGGNPESGLYFELRHQGQTIDPMKWASLK